MLDRRQWMQLGLGVATTLGLSSALRAADSGRTLLILGGTGFIGPHLTTEALKRGWKVTHFNRGKRDADGVPGVELLVGDRKGQLDALKGHRWDAVVDNTGYIPKYVKQSSDLLAPNVGYMLFISSISAYASFAKPNVEDSPVGVLANIEEENITNDTYGPMKALCEQYAMGAFKGRGSVVRPGYIVGPLDPTDRFTYWPVRASRGGEMLAPGTPRDPVQFIDVRDLTTFMMDLVETRAGGHFNAVTKPGQYSIGDLVASSVMASPKADARVTWVPEDFLFKHWKEDEVDVPPWSPMGGQYAGASLTGTDRSVKAGLTTRPIDETVRDTLAWFESLPAERQARLKAGIPPERETATLTAWHAREAK